MGPGSRRCLLAALLCLSQTQAGFAVDAASDLAGRFARYCMADASPYKSANDAANAAKLEVVKGLTGVDMPNPSHIVTTQTWRAGRLGDTELSLVATNIDSGKCRIQACGLVADRLRERGIEAALQKQLKLPAPASRREDSVATEAAWPLQAPAGAVVSFAAQKTQAGDRVTLSVTQLCPQTREGAHP